MAPERFTDTYCATTKVEHVYALVATEDESEADEAVLAAGGKLCVQKDGLSEFA